MQTIDIHHIASTLGFEPEEVEMVLALFLEGAQTSLQNLRKAIEDQDYETIVMSAHSIKGGASNLTLEPIASLAKTIEMAARDRASIDYKAHVEQLASMLAAIS